METGALALPVPAPIPAITSGVQVGVMGPIRLLIQATFLTGPQMREIFPITVGTMAGTNRLRTDNSPITAGIIVGMDPAIIALASRVRRRVIGEVSNSGGNAMV